MQRISSLLILVTLFSVVPGYARQASHRGQVVNRDGAPQQCQISFYDQNNNRAAQVASDQQGYFFVSLPGGTYRVVVVQGSQQTEFRAVTIDDRGLNPATLVVPW